MNPGSTLSSNLLQLVERVRDLFHKAVAQASVEVDDIIQSDDRDTARIERQLDHMLGFCCDPDMLLVFKRLCRHYFTFAPEATAALFPDSFEETELGAVPKGWRWGTLGDVAETARKQIQPEAMQRTLHYVGLEHIPRKCLSLSDWGVAEGLESAKSCFSAGDILFGKLRPYFHEVVVAPVDGVCSTDILVCRSKKSFFYGFVAMQLFSEPLVTYADRLSNGAKMPRVNWKDLAAYEVVIPDEDVAEVFTVTIQPLLNRMAANVHQAQTLATLRDTLLPRLISGRLRLPEAQTLIGEAA